jgi:hypothetical protein
MLGLPFAASLPSWVLWFMRYTIGLAICNWLKNLSLHCSKSITFGVQVQQDIFYLSLLIAFSLFFGVELCLNFFLRFIFHGLTFLLFPFLLSIGIHKVTIHDVHSSSHTLNRYYAMWNKPRPESSIIVCPSLKLTFLSIGYVLCINCGEDDRWIFNWFLSHRTRNLLPISQVFLQNSNSSVKWLQPLSLAGILAQDGWGNNLLLRILIICTDTYCFFFFCFFHIIADKLEFHLTLLCYV